MANDIVTREAPVRWASDRHRSHGLEALMALPFVQEVSGDIDPERIRITLERDSFDPDGLDALIRIHGGEIHGGWRDWVASGWEHIHHHDDRP